MDVAPPLERMTPTLEWMMHTDAETTPTDRQR